MTPEQKRKKWHLNGYVGRETYLVAPITDVDALNNPLGIGTTPEQAVAEMSPLDIDSSEHKAIHGILMPAEVLPADEIKVREMVDAGCKLFLVLVTSSSHDFEGTVAEYDDLDELEADMTDNLYVPLGTVAVANYEPIENYYVLYGYAMDLSVCVAPSELNKEKFNQALKVAKTLVD